MPGCLVAVAAAPQALSLSKGGYDKAPAGKPHEGLSPAILVVMEFEPQIGLRATISLDVSVSAEQWAQACSDEYLEARDPDTGVERLYRCIEATPTRRVYLHEQGGYRHTIVLLAPP